MKRILVIAGSDSSGGAGLEADQKVIAAHGCYAMTATTALTAQNTQGVYGVHETPSGFVQKQIKACVDDIGVDVVKTGGLSGMLAASSTVTVVADALRQYAVKVAIVDPVMVATSGAQLLPEDAVKTLCEELLPNTYIVTPNIPEAKLMLEKTGSPPVDVHDLEGLKNLAKAVHALGPKYVLVKGGHLPLTTERKVAGPEDARAMVANVLYGDDVDEVFELEYQTSRSTHGTGCTLASAIACHLAVGDDVATAVRQACRYVEAGIRTSVNFGQGSGPLNHFHSMQSLPFPPGGFVQYLLERKDVASAWHQYTHHKFVQALGDGTLPHETFKYYMIQDYLYLIQFARANALAGYKAKKLDDIAAAATIVTHIRHEINLHIDECKKFGLDQEAMEQYEESQ
ncbi:trifunctional hydroxymethylpyrimidine kinase/phosphomethylpyrimidine kinase/thiaminase, partial [Elasticomyces elasticus]